MLAMAAARRCRQRRGTGRTHQATKAARSLQSPSSAQIPHDCRVLWIMRRGCRPYQLVGGFEIHATVFWIMRNCLQDRATLP